MYTVSLLCLFTLSLTSLSFPTTTCPTCIEFPRAERVWNRGSEGLSGFNDYFHPTSGTGSFVCFVCCWITQYNVKVNATITNININMLISLRNKSFHRYPSISRRRCLITMLLLIAGALKNIQGHNNVG